jgi:predicted AAA+ superfamily ATPase
MNSYHKRTLEGTIHTLNESFPALLVTGPRQSGKTTLLQHLATADRRYLSLDDPTLRELARQDPRDLLERYAPPVLIDEIQYAPELLPYIKMAIDGNRTPGAYWLTGSQQFRMMKGITETLAGRVGILNLLGYSQRERLQVEERAEPFLPTKHGLAATTSLRGAEGTVEAVFRRIWAGSFPALSTDPQPEERDTFMGSYLQTYLERDVRELSKVGNLDSFMSFIRACAARSGQLLNLSELARDVDISVNTAKSWLSILRASFQVMLLEPYHTNLSKRLVKSRKLYFLDTGLLSYLTRWSSPEALSSGAMAGAVFETFVVSEVIKSWWHRGRTPGLYFYRDKDKREIDLIFDEDGKLYPVEIKRSATVRREWARSFGPLRRLEKPVGPGAVVCLAPESVSIGNNVTAIPVGVL